MPSSITANLNSPYLIKWWVLNNSYNGYIGFTYVDNVVTVGTHPFSTGDKIWVTPTGGNPITRYVIKISDTQISIATSYNNAIAGTASSQDLSLNCFIGNVPAIWGVESTTSSVSVIANPFLGYSKSAQSFAITENVAIDFTVPKWGEKSRLWGQFDLPPWSFGLVSDTGGYSLGLWDGRNFFYGDSVTGVISKTDTYRNDNNTKTSLTFNFRILIQNQRAIIQVKTTTDTYLTLFTSSILSTNIQGLRFFANLSLNGIAFTNCTITYL